MLELLDRYRTAQERVYAALQVLHAAEATLRERSADVLRKRAACGAEGGASVRAASLSAATTTPPAGAAR